MTVQPCALTAVVSHPTSYLLAVRLLPPWAATPPSPDCSTPGMYLAKGGYPVTIATPDACPFQADTHQTADCQRDNYGWGTAKPFAPYKAWLDTFTQSGDRVLVPCAATAPTVIDAEHLDYPLDVLAIDLEPDARDAYHRRRNPAGNTQASLSAWSE